MLSMITLSWSVSTQRGAHHTRYKDQFTRSLMHVLCYGTQHWDIIELMIQLGILLYIVSEDTIDCEPFTNGSGVRLESCRQRYVTNKHMPFCCYRLVNYLFVC